MGIPPYKPYRYVPLLKGMVLEPFWSEKGYRVSMTILI